MAWFELLGFLGCWIWDRRICVSTFFMYVARTFLFLMFFVYILQIPTGQFYVGQTQNLEKRLADHNRVDAFEGKFTRKNGPWGLIWTEGHATRSAAVSREKQIKRMKSARWIKENLLKIRLQMPISVPLRKPLAENW